MSVSIPVVVQNESQSNAQANEIQGIFLRHWETYRSQCEMTRINIDTWRRRTIESIDRYADEQIRILHEDVNYEQNQWNEKLRENLEIIKDCVEAQNLELLTDVRRQCQYLEYQVTCLENINRELQFPQIVTVREQTKRTEQQRNKSIQPQDSPPVTTSVIPKKKKKSDSSKFQSSSSVHNDSSKLSPVAKSSPIEPVLVKDSAPERPTNPFNINLDAICPFCFMIYPPTMSFDDQNLHAQGHFSDEF